MEGSIKELSAYCYSKALEGITASEVMLKESLYKVSINIKTVSLNTAAKTHLIPNCGHTITNAIEYILPFLNRNIS
jgi:hypothetical protein